MAICRIRTLLSLDKYAKIMGINPLRFNGCGQINLSDGNILYPENKGVETVWPQNEWQIAGNISREQIGRLIKDAETEIISFLGWNPTPTWDEQERHGLTPYINRSNNLYISYFQLNKYRFISGGRRASVAVSEDVDVVAVDLNGDGFYETRRVSIATPTNPYEEYKVYFPGQDGDPSYEIRPPRRKRVVGNFLVFEFDTWQLVDPEVWDTEPSGNGTAIDLADESNIVDTVDVYREYNDTTQNHVIFYEEELNTPVMTASGGYIVPSDNMSYIKAIPASYVSGSWVSSSGCSPDDISHCDFWYYSGDKVPKNQEVANHDDYISASIASAIAILASSRIPRAFMANNNSDSLFKDLTTDIIDPDSNANVSVPFDLNDCPFGTRKGEYRAWKAIRNFQQRRFNSATI